MICLRFEACALLRGERPNGCCCGTNVSAVSGEPCVGEASAASAAAGVLIDRAAQVAIGLQRSRRLRLLCLRLQSCSRSGMGDWRATTGGWLLARPSVGLWPGGSRAASAQPSRCCIARTTQQKKKRGQQVGQRRVLILLLLVGTFGSKGRGKQEAEGPADPPAHSADRHRVPVAPLELIALITRRQRTLF